MPVPPRSDSAPRHTPPGGGVHGTFRPPMSSLPDLEPECTPGNSPCIELLIAPRPRDLGGFSVRRVLPVAARRMVGPFIFYDHMGPATMPIGEGVDVRPHPHIGLA